jgi:Fe-S-cluster containining protein
MKRPADGGTRIKSFEQSEKDFMKAFECKQCGRCCYGEGGISLENAEVDAISQFLEMPSEPFINRFCEKRNGKISVRTGKDGYCIFYDHQERCLIHPVKPLTCVLWPFYPALLKDKDNWSLAKDACPGINPDCSFEEFVKQGKKRAAVENWKNEMLE